MRAGGRCHRWELLVGLALRLARQRGLLHLVSALIQVLQGYLPSASVGVEGSRCGGLGGLADWRSLLLLDWRGLLLEGTLLEWAATRVVDSLLLDRLLLGSLLAVGWLIPLALGLLGLQDHLLPQLLQLVEVLLQVQLVLEYLGEEDVELVS